MSNVDTKRENNMERKLINRWESRTGKHWVELHQDRYGYNYTSETMGGCLGDVSRNEALAYMLDRVIPNVQPDRNKTAMKMVVSNA